MREKSAQPFYVVLSRSFQNRTFLQLAKQARLLGPIGKAAHGFLVGVRGGGEHGMVAGGMATKHAFGSGVFSMRRRCVPMGPRPSRPTLMAAQTLHP